MIPGFGRPGSRRPRPASPALFLRWNRPCLPGTDFLRFPISPRPGTSISLGSGLRRASSRSHCPSHTFIQALRFPDALPCPHLHPIRMLRFLDALPCPHLHQIRMPRFLAAPPCPRLHPGRMLRFLDAPPCPYLHPYRARLFPDALRRLYTKRQPAFPGPGLSCSRAPGVPGGYLPFPYLIPYPLYDLPSSDVHLSYDSF